MQTQFAQSILQRKNRLAMPIGVYAGLEIIGASVYQAVTNAQVQLEAVLALHERFHTAYMLTAMDLSAEAETFGCQIRMPEDEIPTVVGRLVIDEAQIRALRMPEPGELRTAVHLGAAESLVKTGKVPVLGGCIGPFSLAGRIFGVSEALEATSVAPEMMHLLLEKVTQYLTRYVLAFREVGVMGVIMAEPAAGLLSPRGLGQFSSRYVKQIVEAVQTPNFTVILHNCGAKIAHLPKVLEAGAEVFHFGEPMNIPAALQQVEGKVILGGNLDPSAVFFGGSVEEVQEKTHQLMDVTRTYPNYFISSGCDLPPGVPIQNMDAFYQTVADFAVG